MGLLNLITKLVDKRNILKNIEVGWAKEEERQKKGGANKVISILTLVENDTREAKRAIEKWLKDRNKT